MRDDLIFLLLDSVPMRLRGRLYLWICRRQMERWHPVLRTDPDWRSRFTTTNQPTNRRRPDMPDTRNCYCGPGAIRHDAGAGRHCRPRQGSGTPADGQPAPHQIHDDVFDDAHMTAAGAIMGARMAGKKIPQWSADMNEAFRVAVAEAFDAGYRFGQEAAR